MDAEASIPTAWRAGTANRVVVLARQAGSRFLGSLKGLQIRAQPNTSFPFKKNLNQKSKSQADDFRNFFFL